jgi:ABC-type antimicrobial peptide transport system permease subunit
MALLLAGIGICGLVSYLVEQRTRECGIRVALGARPRVVWRTVRRESLQPTLVGVIVGSAGALAPAESRADPKGTDLAGKEGRIPGVRRG